MLLQIPGCEEITIINVVFDYNGTIALDGILLPIVREKIKILSESFQLFVLTADTYGNVERECQGLPITVKKFDEGVAGIEKANIIRQLGASETICFGNGFNDIQMFDLAQLSVAILGEEGCSGKLLSHADIVVKSIDDAFLLLEKPKRIIADLRY